MTTAWFRGHAHNTCRSRAQCACQAAMGPQLNGWMYSLLCTIAQTLQTLDFLHCPRSIHSLLNQIKNEEIVLPGIQRDFVWPKERITRLLDSIMRGYPIGITLIWETYNDIQYRTFVKDHRQETLYAYRDNPRNRSATWGCLGDGRGNLTALQWYLATYTVRSK